MRGFRNLVDADLALPDAGCVIVGPNGHGKTSLLEALLYCEVFRSFRGALDRELVAFGSDGFRVAVEVGRTGAQPYGRTEDEGRGTAAAARRHTVAAGYDARTREKKLSLDGAPVIRAQDALGAVRGVVLSPGDVSLVAGGPKERRRYLDVVLALTVPGYVEALVRYRRALAHKGRATAAELPAWERMLAERGAALVEARRRWAAAWAERYAELCAAMGEQAAPGGAAASTLVYQPSVDGDADALAAALERHRARDHDRGRTSVGPHRDRLRLLRGGHELRAYGSAGQHRTAAIALRLCEAETLRAEGGAAPVTICLDDAFAELDAERGRRLARLIEQQAAAGSQVVAAVPKVSDLPQRSASRALGALPVREIREGRVT